MKFWLPVAEQETVLEESMSLKALLFPLLQKALCPQVEKQLRSDFFFIFLDFGIYWIGDWKSYSLYLMWGVFLDFLWTRALFSAIITPFYISNKNCSLCSLNRCIFLICSSFHMPILLQEWSLFWKGTVTSFCKICITNFSEVLPLPKPQKYQMACSTVAVLSLSHGWMCWTTLSLWLCWRLGAFSNFPYCMYSQPAPTISKIKIPSWEQIMELLLASFLRAPRGWARRLRVRLSCQGEPWAFGKCCVWEQTHPVGRFIWSVAFILKTDMKAVTCSPVLIKHAWDHSALPKWC